MIIDFHSHLYPKAYRDLGLVPPSMFDEDELLRRMDADGIDRAVVHSPGILVGPGAPSLNELAHIKTYNDYAVDLNQRQGDRLTALAAANPFGGDAHLQETERAVRQGGLPGIAINSSVDGQYLDAPAAREFMALARDLGVFVFVHPPTVTVGAAQMGAYRLVESMGRPFDTALSIGRAVLSGLLEDLPDLQLVCAHIGGALLSVWSRLDVGWQARRDPTFGPWGPERISAPPSAYLKKLYVDTMGFHLPTLRAGVETWGVDRVLFGSDYPPVDLPLRQSVAMVRRLGLSADETALILGGTARKLLRL